MKFLDRFMDTVFHLKSRKAQDELILAIVRYYYTGEEIPLKTETANVAFAGIKATLSKCHAGYVSGKKKKPKQGSGRVPLTPKQRMRILERDGFRCQYCGRSAPDVVLEIDHIVPISKGGSNNEDNLITACWECNLGKSDDLIEV